MGRREYFFSSTSATGAPSSSTPPRPSAIPAHPSLLPGSPTHQPSSVSGTIGSGPTTAPHSNRRPRPRTCVANHQAMAAELLPMVDFSVLSHSNLDGLTAASAHDFTPLSCPHADLLPPLKINCIVFNVASLSPMTPASRRGTSFPPFSVPSRERQLLPIFCNRS
jgi:hypothetical protein